MNDFFANRALFVLHLNSLPQDAVPTALVMATFSDGVVNNIFTTNQALIVGLFLGQIAKQGSMFFSLVVISVVIFLLSTSLISSSAISTSLISSSTFSVATTAALVLSLFGLFVLKYLHFLRRCIYVFCRHVPWVVF